MSKIDQLFERIRQRRTALENAEAEVRELEEAFQDGAEVAENSQIHVTTKRRLGEISIAADWYVDEPPSNQLSDQIYSDQWKTVRLYRGGGHAQSKPEEYEYHIRASTTIDV